MTDQPQSTYNKNEDVFQLGEHCARPDCHQRDFLPIRCDKCRNYYCKEHFLYSDHSCPAAAATEGQKQQQNGDPERPAIQCPLCSQWIIIQDHQLQLVDRIIDDHIRMGCPPVAGSKQAAAPASRPAAARPLRACQHSGCSNKALVQCRTCHKFYCLEHRIEGDHVCQAPPTVTQSARALLGSAGAKIGAMLGSNSASGTPSAASSTTSQLGIKKKGSDYRTVNSKLGEIHRARQQGTVAPAPVAAPVVAAAPAPVPQQQQPSKSVSITPATTKKVQIVMEKKMFQNQKYKPEGQSSIEQPDRFFLSVYFPLRSGKRPAHMFFSKNWKLGRVLDKICEFGKVINNNTQTTDPAKRLSLFLLPSGMMLPNDKTLLELQQLGMLSPYDSVILEYGSELSQEVQDAVQRVFSDPESAVSAASAASGQGSSAVACSIM